MGKTITVFGSSKPAAGEEQYSSGYELGKKLAENGFNVCTGGFNGIMEAVSKGANEMGMDPTGFLENNDSYHFFENLDDLVKTGPTNTNVMDLRVVLVST